VTGGTGSRKWPAILVALTLGVAIALAWAGRASEGKRALADADGALLRGDVTDAILAARTAAEARCPGCAAPDQGFAKLEKIARDAEARGDDATAFAAWRATRAALLATTVTGSSSARRAHADVEVARFAHRLDAAAVAAGAAPTPAAAEDKLRAGMNESELPSGMTFGLIGLGTIVFLFGAVRFVMSKKRVELGAALAGGLTATIAALLF
jgi:hypothetical protein